MGFFQDIIGGIGGAIGRIGDVAGGNIIPKPVSPPKPQPVSQPETPSSPKPAPKTPSPQSTPGSVISSIRRKASSTIKSIIAPIIGTTRTREASRRLVADIGRLTRKITEAARPQSQQQRLAMDQIDKAEQSAVTQHNIDVQNQNKAVQSFNTNFGGGNLSQSQFKAAQQLQTKLQTSEQNILQSERNIDNFELQRKELERISEIKRKNIPKLIRLSQSITIGALTAPLGLVSLALTAKDQPKEAVTGVLRGFKELPSEFVARPIETAGEFAGGAAFFALAGAGVAKLKGATPKISQSFSATNAVKVGKTIKGVSRWRVEGSTITKLIHPKTGQVLKTIRTKSVTTSVAATSKSGALKSVSETWAASVTKDLRVVLGKTPKVKLEATLTKAKGTITLEPTQVKGLFKGVGTGQIQEAGRIALTKPIPTGPIKPKIKLKPGKKFDTISNLLVKDIGKPRPAARIDLFPEQRVAVGTIGTERAFAFKTVTDITKVGKTAQVLRAEGLGIGKAFVPKKKLVAIGDFIVGPSKIKTKIPKISKAPKAATQKLVSRRVPSEVVSKLVAETTGRQIGRAALGRVKRVAVKQTPVSKVSQALVSGTVSVARTRQKVRPAQSFAQALTGKMVKPTRQVSVKVTPVSKRAQSVSQTFIQQLGFAQPPRIRQIQRQTTRPITPSPIVPKKPVIIIPFAPKRPQVVQRRRRGAGAKRTKAQQRKFQASVGAVVLNITGKRPKKGKLFTGFELRPLVGRKRRKKSKKRASKLERAFRL